MQGTAEDLPHGWARTTLGNICSKPEYGWTTKAANSVLGPKLLRTTDISKGAIDWSTVPVCTQAPPFLDKYLLKKGDIVISRAGSVGLSALIGDCPEAVFASYLIRLRVQRGINVKFVHYFLQCPSYWEQIAQESAGIALQNVNAKKLAALNVPLAPLPEQRRIIAEVEKQFNRLDASEAALKSALANLKRYRASVLKTACEGRLVPTEAELAQVEGRDYEPADQLLERILAERRARWEAQGKKKGKYKEPVAPDTSDLTELPGGWSWATVDQLASHIQYGTSLKASTDASGIPVLRMGNIQDGNLDFSDLKYISSEDIEAKKTLLNPGDLLFNRTNSAELVGKSAVYSTGHPPSCFASYLIRVIFMDGCASEYVCFYINSQLGRVYINQVRSQQVGQANVNGTKLAAMPVPLPAPSEQHRIIAEVERRLSITQQAEATVETSLKRVEQLRQSILKQAFSGQLVPQDPNDEPASALLERIKAERAAAEAVSSRKKKTRRSRSKISPDKQLSLLESVQ